MEEIVINVIKSSGKPLKSGEIAQLSGIDKKQVDLSIKKLISDEKIYSPKRCYYDLRKL
ncbi:MAG: MarR family transcriptional regulator [Bacteroidales bacterium]|nr:MarR family transcriptional regulator [Bacteroidales bacterium]MCF8403971.1 MarR family transcriptional regulator [Bacteroidales bacterium]